MLSIKRVNLPQLADRAFSTTRRVIELKLTLAGSVPAQINRFLSVSELKSLVADGLMSTALGNLSLRDLLKNATIKVDQVETVEWIDTVTEEAPSGSTKRLLADVTFQKVKSATVTIGTEAKTQRIVVSLDHQRETVNREWWE